MKKDKRYVVFGWVPLKAKHGKKASEKKVCFLMQSYTAGMRDRGHKIKPKEDYGFGHC